MDIDELQKQLYGQKEGEVRREGAPEQFQPGHEAGQQGLGSSQWEKEAGGKSPIFNAGMKRMLKLAVVALVALGVIIGGFLYWRSQSFDSKKVTVTIFSIDRVASGEEVNYVVRYQNKNKVSLTGLKLTFIYPENSLPSDKKHLTQIGNLQASVIDLPDLEAGNEGKAEFLANVAGLKDDKKSASAKLSYHAGNTSSDFESTGEFTSVIFSVPLVLDFSLPDRVVNGQKVDITLKYLNTSDINFSELKLTLEYPPGFSFNSSAPSPTQGSDIWDLAEIGPKEEGKILISGVLTGTQEEVKNFKAKIIKQQGDSVKILSDGLASTLISLSPLAVTLSVNDSRDYLANVDDILYYKLTYQNTTGVPIGPVLITVKFDTRALDYSTVEVTDGFFSSVDNTIVWNESTLRYLKSVQPGEKTVLKFSARVKSNLPITKFNDKNFIISVAAKIDTLSIPVSLQGTLIGGSDILNTKVNSKLYLSSEGFYKDDAVPNTGPIPPKINQQTTYTIYWDVVNLANDVDNVVVESYLPPYVSWLGIYDPAGADIKYDKNTGKITWTIGKLSANVGILSPVKRFVFKIGLVPSISQVRGIVDLLNESIITGTDTFTSASLRGTAEIITSELRNDSSIPYGGGLVTE